VLRLDRLIKPLGLLLVAIVVVVTTPTSVLLLIAAVILNDRITIPPTFGPINALPFVWN
jgi:hypothetical protein